MEPDTVSPDVPAGRPADQPGDPPASGAPAVLVPIKAFSQAKQRLAGELTAKQRALLAQAMGKTMS